MHVYDASCISTETCDDFSPNLSFSEIYPGNGSTFFGTNEEPNETINEETNEEAKDTTNEETISSYDELSSIGVIKQEHEPSIYTEKNKVRNDSHVFVNTNRKKRSKRKVPNRNKKMMCVTICATITLFVLWLYRVIAFSLRNNIYNLLWIPITFLSLFILLFPIHIMVSAGFNIFGSIEFFFENSKYYSCIKETRSADNIITHTNVTIQISIHQRSQKWQSNVIKLSFTH